jgi:hypothetical protein
VIQDVVAVVVGGWETEADCGLVTALVPVDDQVEITTTVGMEVAA